MATQIVSVTLKAVNQAEYDKMKVVLPDIKLPTQPVFNDLLKEVYINFTEDWILPK